MEQTGRHLAPAVQEKLVEVLINPRVEANRLRHLPDCYKLKLRSGGYRLIYQVLDQEVVVFVVAIGKREREAAYQEHRQTNRSLRSPASSGP